jgi:hypothetical protein
MNDDALERLLAKHRLAGPEPDLRIRTLTRATAAWRASDGDPLTLQLWRFGRTWGLGVAAVFLLNLTVGGLLGRLSRVEISRPLPTTPALAVREWQELCHDLELPDAMCQRLQLRPAAPPAEDRRERLQLERELSVGG